MPYQRSATFKKILHVSLQDQVSNFLGRHAGAERVSITLGRVIAKGTQRDISLHVGNMCALDDSRPAHDFEPEVTREVLQGLRAKMDAQQAAWAQTKPADRRWAEFRTVERAFSIPPPPAAVMTFYCPGSRWHFQLRVGPARGPSTDMRCEMRYQVQKSASPDGLWWRLSLCKIGLGCQTSGYVTDMEVNANLLWENYASMRNGHAHSFSILVKCLLDNAEELTSAVRRGTAFPMFYPGLHDTSSMAVSAHYDQKAGLIREMKAQGDWTGGKGTKAGGAKSGRKGAESDVAREPSRRIREHNNLVKTLLLEQFVDPLPGPVRVLDLGCGHGQDLLKFSPDHRQPPIVQYVGMDFAAAAITEAKKRYAQVSEMLGARVFPASFYIGDLRNEADFAILRGDGHSYFNLVTLHFSLQYIAESEDVMRAFFRRIHAMLRPGGYVIGSAPGCDAVGEHFSAAQAVGASEAADSWEFANSLYSLKFGSPAWGPFDSAGSGLEDALQTTWGLWYNFTLAGAVAGQDEYVVPWESLEAVLSEVGFRVILDAQFPDVYTEYREASAAYKSVFLPRQKVSGASGALDHTEQQLFGFYSAFVLQKPEDG